MKLKEKGVHGYENYYVSRPNKAHFIRGRINGFIEQTNIQRKSNADGIEI